MPDYTQATSPCFVLDEKRLRRNMEILNNIQERTGVKIICALKGYSFWIHKGKYTFCVSLMSICYFYLISSAL